MKTRFNKEEYIKYIDFSDRDVDIRCNKIKLVKCKKDHECFFGLLERSPHNIKLGEYARVETALIDQEFWGTYYVCIPCMDNYITKELGLVCGDCLYWDYKHEDNLGRAKCLNKKSKYFDCKQRHDNTCPNFKEYLDEEL